MLSAAGDVPGERAREGRAADAHAGEESARLGAAALEASLRQRLDAGARAWLDGALADARRAAATGPEPAADAAPGARRPLPAWELAFAAAGRHCRAAATGAAPAPAPVPEAADAARVLLLHAARPDTGTLTRLYTRGSAAERRAVLVALPWLPVDDDGVPLVEDALRANDTRLVAAAVGPYAAARLGAHAWRQAILKCLFTGVPVTAVAGLAERAAGDAELARMLRDYAAERAAAGRPVPDDLHHVLALTETHAGNGTDAAPHEETRS